MSNTEEFEFFKRIEDLEKTTKGFEVMKITAQENTTIAIVALYIAFCAFYFDSPHEARKGKDLIMLGLKRLGLSSQVLDKLEETMLGSCDALEKLKRS